MSDDDDMPPLFEDSSPEESEDNEDDDEKSQAETAPSKMNIGFFNQKQKISKNPVEKAIPSTSLERKEIIRKSDTSAEEECLDDVPELVSESEASDSEVSGCL